MRFDPTNPQKVPLPAPVPKKKRGQQKIPPVPVTAGTIRKVHAKSVGENSVHGSDAPDTAQKEIAQFFAGKEIVG